MLGGHQGEDTKNSAGRFGEKKPSKKIEPGKPTYDEKRSEHFQLMMKKNTRPEKDIRLSNHLTKFEDEMKRQRRQAEAADLEDQQLKLKMSQDTRKQQLNKL